MFGVRSSVCPVFFANVNKARGAYSTRLTRGSKRRGQRTFPSGYYKDGHTCSLYCGFVVQYAVQQIHSKYEANPRQTEQVQRLLRFPLFYRTALCWRSMCCGPIFVRLSIRRTQASIVPKQLNVESRKQRRTIAQGLYSFLTLKDRDEIRMGSISTEANANAHPSNAYTRLNSHQRRDTWLNGTGFTQFYLPPTRLSTNGMSHPACIS